MNEATRQDRERLAIGLRLTEKEAQHLLAVRARLLGDVGQPNPDWLQRTLDTPEGIDRLESFNAKFSRLQDTIMDKLLPRLLRAAGELSGTAIDNLNRAEQLGLVSQGDDWVAMRRLSNLLVHEDVEDPADMLTAITTANAFCDELTKTQAAITDYANKHLEIPPTH